MDITTIVYYALMGVALLGADAFLFADSVIARVEVAKKYDEGGLSVDLVDALVSREMQAIFANESVVRRPAIRAATEKSVVSVIAKSLNLDDITFAFQHLFGLDPAEVNLALLDNGDGQILLTGQVKGRAPFSVIVVRGRNEEMQDFLRRAALEAAIRLDPYHASLYMLEKQDVQKQLPRVKEIIQEEIKALRPTPRNEVRALFRNLQGIAALLENDVTRGAGFFEQAVRDTDNYGPAILNLGFARVEQDRYADAIDVVRPVIEGRTVPRLPALTASAHTIAAVSYWALKRYEDAERHFGVATRLQPDVSDAFEYWGRMLQERGRAAEGAEKRRIAAQNLERFEQYPEVALLYFWLTEKDNQRLTRRALGSR